MTAPHRWTTTILCLIVVCCLQVVLAGETEIVEADLQSRTDGFVSHCTIDCRPMPNMLACRRYDGAPCAQLWSEYDQCSYRNRENEVEDCTPIYDALDACSAPYKNLYLLFWNEAQQEVLKYQEESAVACKHKKIIPLPSFVDWTPYAQFFREHGSAFSQTLPNASFPRDTPLWKKLPENTEPKLIPLEIDLPLAACGCVEEKEEYKTEGRIYAVDQNGKILGTRVFVSNPGMEARSDRPKEQANGAMRVEKITFEPVVKVHLDLLPGDTASIQLKLFSQVSPYRDRYPCMDEERVADRNFLQYCSCETEVLPLPTAE